MIPLNEFISGWLVDLVKFPIEDFRILVSIEVEGVARH